MWLTISEAKERNILETTKFGPKVDTDGRRLTLKDTSDWFMKFGRKVESTR